MEKQMYWLSEEDTKKGRTFMSKQHEQLLAKLKNPESCFILLEDMAKRWFAHDGLWFQAVEKEYGMVAAIKMDATAWEKFTVLEAERIKKLFQLPENGGIPVLKEALGLRLYAFLNQQEIIDINPNKIIFRMNDCRVQSARKRKNLCDFPCKSVGLVEYSGFAGAIDPRVKTRCIACPPDDHPDDYYCAWEFWI